MRNAYFNQFTEQIPANFGASAVVYNVGGVYYAVSKNGVSLASSSSDAGAVINAALASSNHVKIMSGTYVCTTSIAFTAAGQWLEGEGEQNTILSFNGGTLSPLIKMNDTTVRAFLQISNLSISSSVTGSGLGINADYFTVSRITNVQVDGVNQGIDISNGNSFYNYIDNVRITCSGASGFGIRLAKNEQTVIRTRISANDSNNVSGIVVNAHGCGLISCNVESGANVILIGIDIQAGGHDTTVTDVYLEANATNLKLAASVESFVCIGGFIGDGVSADITDSGATSPAFLSTRTGTSSFDPYTSMPLIGSEANNTPKAGGNDTVIGATVRRYTFFTLPTTYKYYIITGIEWLNGTVVNGTTFAAVELVDASPPVAAQLNLVAWSRAVTQTGASGVQRNSAISSLLIPGGSILGAYVATNSASGRYGTTTVSSNNNDKSLSGTPVLADTTAWTATTEEPYVKVYYKPLLGVQQQ